MNFEFPAAAEEFRMELRQFLADELPDWWTHMFYDDERVFPFTRQFCQKLAKRGWLTTAWPTEYGGQDANIWMQLTLSEEMRLAGEPRGPQYMNLNYIGPLIMNVGTPEQKERFLKPMTAGDVIWCQGFSEPGAGSDLAAVKTQASDNGSGYVISGQKIWTSYAPHADWCLLVARSDPESQRHKGLSLFAVNMKTPGLTVRPIDSLAGPSEINELFFDDVEVPYDCLIGELDQGWAAIVSALANERLGMPFHAYSKVVYDQIFKYAKEQVDETGRPLAERSSVREGLLKLHARWRGGRLMAARMAAGHAEGNADAVGAAIFKTFCSESYMFGTDVGFDLMGAGAQLGEVDPMAPLQGVVPSHWKLAIPSIIAAGSSEIQRNIIAQRGLGLPR